MFPIVGGGPEIGRLRAITLAIIGVVARSFGGMVPVFHHLAHGRRHATRVASAARPVACFRSVQVVGGVLVPLGSADEVDATATVAREHSACCGHALPFLFGVVEEDGVAACAGLGDFVEVEHQFGRGILCHEGAFVGVAHDGTETVVSRDDDETVIAYVESIETYFTTV